jgi:glycosyltransferase involved in cell wall biosynthesis
VNFQGKSGLRSVDDCGERANRSSARRILFIQKYSSLGGSQVSLVHHLELLDRNQFEPRVVISNTGWLTSKLDAMDIPWSILKFGHWTNPLSIPRNISLIGRLRNLIRREGIDLVHANEHWVAPVAYFAAKLSGVPVVCHFRTGLQDLTRLKIRKYLYSRFDRVLVVADVLRAAMVRHVSDPSRILVVRDGVEIGAEPTYPQARRRVFAINVGAIYEVKGQAKILRLALPWLKADSGRYLVFVGGTRTDPSYVNSMKQLVADQGLDRQVRFLGSRDDVPRLLRMADVLVAYSTVEGVPRVVMEAMFAGRPVIVSNTPGMSEVVEDGVTGRILDLDGADNHLAATLSDMSARRRDWQAMGRRGYDRAVSRYSTRAMTKAIESVYSELLERPNHVPAKY